MGFISSFMQVEAFITVLAGLAVFGTVYSIISPFMESDKLSARMKGVTVERDRLKAQQKLSFQSGEVKLRDKTKAGGLTQLVELLNLKNIFEAEPSREKLRRAGFRSERHLVFFLAARAIVPIVVGILVFVYTSTLYANKVSPNMRITSSLIAMVAGLCAPDCREEHGNQAPKFDQESLVRCPRSVAHLR